MPGFRSNTKYRCRGCGAIFDFSDLASIRECEHCGLLKYEQIVVAYCCDFCSTSEADEWWTFPCADFKYEVQFEGYPEHGSQGDWLCCGTCYELILADNRTEMAQRAVRHDLERHPEMKSHYHYLVAITRRMHSGFFANRTGDPYREEEIDGPRPETDR